MPTTAPRPGGHDAPWRDGPWNHNTHYHRLIPRVAPPPYRRVLDVGCGEGLLTRRLAEHADHVVGIDTSAPMVTRARAEATARDLDQVEYLHGDALTTRLGDPFDLVTCVATLHHLDLEAGLARLGELTAPGGTLVVVGLANPSSAGDFVMGALGVPAARWSRWRRGSWDPQAPVADPTVTYGDVRAAARRILPGAQVRVRLYWRYTLVWRRPLSA